MVVCQEIRDEIQEAAAAKHPGSTANTVKAKEDKQLEVF